MNTIELEMMKGMISILNEAAEAYNTGNPIMTKEQFDTRLADLKQFEEETGFILLSSPTCKNLIKSLLVYRYRSDYDFEKCDNVENIIGFACQREMLVYPNLTGVRATITYANGVMVALELHNGSANFNKVGNIPYKINKKECYTVRGVIASDSSFYVIEVIRRDGNLKNDLIEAKELGFDIIPYWVNANTANALNPKNLQNNIDYVFEYANENEYSFDGVVFRLNDDRFQTGIIYEEN